MTFEVLEVPKTSFGKAHSHTAYSQCLRELVAFIDGPVESLIVEPIIDGPIVKFVAIDALRQHDERPCS